MFYKYLVEEFFPWSLKMDYKNSVSLITKEKEKFICDMFNHIASSYNEVATYELHMFRVSFNKITLLNFDYISIVLPNHLKYHSIYIVYNDSIYKYYLLNKTNSKYELTDVNGKSHGSVDVDFNNISTVISNSIIKA